MMSQDQQMSSPSLNPTCPISPCLVLGWSFRIMVKRTEGALPSTRAGSAPAAAWQALLHQGLCSSLIYFSGHSYLFFCVLFREKTLHISASSIRNFLFTGNPVVLGKSFVTVWKYNYSLKNILCGRDHPVFSLRKTDPVQHRFSFSQEICGCVSPQC